MTTHPLPDTPGAEPTPPAPASHTGRTVVLLTIGLLLAAAVVTWVVVGLVRSANQTDISGVHAIGDRFDAVSLSAEVADVAIEHGNVDEPELRVTHGVSSRERDLDVRVQGSTLEVTLQERRGFPWFTWPWTADARGPELTLVLPEDAEVDVAVDTDVGDIRIDGRFGVAELESNVGDIRIEGSVERLGARGDVGDITARLAEPPTALDVASDVGDLDLTIPPGDYRVDARSSIGTVSLSDAGRGTAGIVYVLRTNVGDITVR